MKNRRAVGLLNPMRDKIEGKNRGGEGSTPVTTACPEGGKYKCAKKRKTVQVNSDDSTAYHAAAVPISTPMASNAVPALKV